MAEPLESEEVAEEGQDPNKGWQDPITQIVKIGAKKTVGIDYDDTTVLSDEGQGDKIFTLPGMRQELKKLALDPDVPVRERRQALAQIADLCGLRSFREDASLRTMSMAELKVAWEDVGLPLLMIHISTVESALARKKHMKEVVLPAKGAK